MATDKWINRGILVRSIIEILGAPKEHIEQTLKDYVKKLKEWDTLSVVKTDFAEPEQQETLYSAFVEMEFWIQDLPSLMGFCIEAMPSSVEIIEPEEFRVDATQMTDMFNDLQSRIHSVDKHVKDLTAQQKLDRQNIKALQTNFVMHLLREGKKDISTLSKHTGVGEKNMEKLLQQLVKSSKVSEENGYYIAR